MKRVKISQPGQVWHFEKPLNGVSVVLILSDGNPQGFSIAVPFDMESKKEVISNVGLLKINPKELECGEYIYSLEIRTFQKVLYRVLSHFPTSDRRGRDKTGYSLHLPHTTYTKEDREEILCYYITHQPITQLSVAHLFKIPAPTLSSWVVRYLKGGNSKNPISKKYIDI